METQIHMPTLSLSLIGGSSVLLLPDLVAPGGILEGTRGGGGGGCPGNTGALLVTGDSCTARGTAEGVGGGARF